MARNEHSGYPLKWFKDQNAARHALYECGTCLEVLKNPVQIRDCGHQFCALCIDDILKTDPRCPSCRIEISDVMIFEDHAARRLIKQLDVNCCNEGCSWVGCLSSLLQDHRSSCNFLIRSGNNVHQLDVEKIEQKLETLLLNVSTLERKHEKDTKELKLKHEKDIKELELKHDEDVSVLRQEILMSRAMGADRAPQVVQQPSPNPEPKPAYCWNFQWKIENFTHELAQALCNNDHGEMKSLPFFSSHGYKMQLSAYLNEGSNESTRYMGVYFRLMKSGRDGSLAWPFTKTFGFVLVDQQDDPSQIQNIECKHTPGGEIDYKRPRQVENAFRGFPGFVKHSTLRTRQYIRADAVCIKFVVDP